MTSTDIIKKLEFAHKLQNKRKTILIEGNWGIGKTYSYKEFIKKNNLKEIYISLFNILDINEIDKKIIVKYFLKYNNKIPKNLKNKIKNIFNNLRNIFYKKIKADTLIKNLLDKLDNFAGINLNNFFEIIDINTLDFDRNTVICFDDLERLNDNLNFKNILGKIEQLHNKVTIVIICNTEKLLEENKKIFDEYKEKVIDNIYQMSELDLDFITEFIKELNLKTESQKFLIDFFLENGNNNLRYLQKIKDDFEELKLICENTMWFFNYEKDILEGIAYLEAEKNFQIFSKKHLENLIRMEMVIQKKEREELDIKKLEKMVNFLEEISERLKKLVKILNEYTINNNDVKKELEEYFSNEKIYKKFYQLCYLYFLKGENEILNSFKQLKTLFLENFDQLDTKDKYYSFIVLNNYLKDLSLRKLSDGLNLNKEREKLKDYMKVQIKKEVIIDWFYQIEFLLDKFNSEAEKSILKKIEEECKKEIEKELEEKIMILIKNKKFEEIGKLKNKNIKIHSYKAVQNFFDPLMFENCPNEYWKYSTGLFELFDLLDDNLKKEIIEKIDENIRNNKSYIIKMRNQYLRNNLKRDHFI